MSGDHSSYPHASLVGGKRRNKRSRSRGGMNSSATSYVGSLYGTGDQQLDNTFSNTNINPFGNYIRSVNGLPHPLPTAAEHPSYGGKRGKGMKKRTSRTRRINKTRTRTRRRHAHASRRRH